MFDLDLLKTNANTPTLYTALITVVLSFILSACIAITYKFTTNPSNKDKQFLQSLSLISIVAATIMLAVGDSLAIGLGMLGALSIIRFRTTLTNPRNITFIFAALASGISCGVLGYNIAFVGTLVFCISVIILYYSPWADFKGMNGIVRVFFKKNYSEDQAILDIFNEYCYSYELNEIKIATTNGANAKKRRSQNIYEYDLFLKEKQTPQELLHKIDAHPNIKQVQFFTQKNANKL